MSDISSVFLKDKRAEITLQDLRESIDETSINNKPINGIVHTTLIDGILEIIDGTGLMKGMSPIVIQDGGASRLPGISKLPLLANQYGDNDIRSYIIRRFYTAFMMKDKNASSVMGIALTYTQDGICIAIGPNVKVCSNWCIYSADQFVSTYGPNKVPAEKLLTIVGGWMNRYPEIVKSTLDMEEKMKKVEITMHDAQDFFGKLHIERVARDKNMSTDWIYPMNQTQINDFTYDYLKAVQDKGNESMNLWKFYNIGTNHLKPQTVDIPNLLPQSLKLGATIIDHFQHSLN